MAEEEEEEKLTAQKPNHYQAQHLQIRVLAKLPPPSELKSPKFGVHPARLSEGTFQMSHHKTHQLSTFLHLPLTPQPIPIWPYYPTKTAFVKATKT